MTLAETPNLPDDPPQDQQRRYKAPARRLIEAAERLISERGIDNVSMVAIAEAAGNANKNAVQYHFGSREALIDAVFDIRLREINAKRQLALDAWKTSSDRSLTALLKVFLQPIADQVGPGGRHLYARFASQVRNQPLYRAGWFGSKHLTAVSEVFRKLRELVPTISDSEFSIRIIFCMEVFDRALAMIDAPESFYGVGTAQIPDAQIPDAQAIMGAAYKACRAILEAPAD